MKKREIEIRIIRHGKTVANTVKLICGSSNFTLTDEGKEEIERYKSEGIYPEADFCFLSSLRRTKQTMDIIYPEAEFVRNKLLDEMYYGDFELIPVKEAYDIPELREFFNDKTGNIVLKNGESLNMYIRRVKKAVRFVTKECIKRNETTATVISHGGLIRVVLGLCLGEKTFGDKWIVKNGHGIVIVTDGENIRLKGFIGDEISEAYRFIL